MLFQKFEICLQKRWCSHGAHSKLKPGLQRLHPDGVLGLKHVYRASGYYFFYIEITDYNYQSYFYRKKA
ncbi:MAG: hypothetical protein H7122_00405 [Chitinophagaceae bacterium]|nr:hypothetical protein [Chitinophagaceae bacterium]